MKYEQNIFWNNIPYPKGRVFKKLGFLGEILFKNTFLKDIKNPCIIWTGTGRIEPLEKFKLKNKTKNVITKKNLEFHFYLFEPLCARIGFFNRSFYSEFDSTENIKEMVSDEIESILIFVKNNNISNFRIFTTDYNVQLIKNNYPDIKINCLDIFLREMSYGYARYPQLKNKIIKKFWCGNWRYTAHRHIVTSYISNFDGYYTWNLSCSFKELEKNNWFDFNRFEKEYPEKYEKVKLGVEFLENNILSIDQNVQSVLVDNFENVFIPGHNAPHRSLKFLESYKNSFCGIINETRFAQPFGNFSEKTLTAIWAKIPFILIAPPKTLEYLKTFGFKTFSQWWDESYDLEENHYKRMIKIFELIDFIDKKSIEELESIYNEMSEILEQNKKIIDTIPMNSTIL